MHIIYVFSKLFTTALKQECTRYRDKNTPTRNLKYRSGTGYRCLTDSKSAHMLNG